MRTAHRSPPPTAPDAVSEARVAPASPVTPTPPSAPPRTPATPAAPATLAPRALLSSPLSDFSGGGALFDVRCEDVPREAVWDNADIPAWSDDERPVLDYVVPTLDREFL